VLLQVRVRLDMKVELGEGIREPGVVAEDRQIHGYGGAGVVRSEAPSSNRAVAVVQQQGEVGGASSGGLLANGRAGGAGGVGRAGLRNGLRATAGLREGAAVVTVQHSGAVVADASALVGSGKYRQQVGEIWSFFCFFFSFFASYLSGRGHSAPLCGLLMREKACR